MTKAGYYKGNREKILEYRHHYYTNLYRRWNGGFSCKTFKDKEALGFEAERVAFQTILPMEGFKDIIWTKIFSKRRIGFPFFDFLAKKEGEFCGIQVTTALHRAIDKFNREAIEAFLKFFNMQYYMCFVKPNLKEYLLLSFGRRIPTSLLMTEKRQASFKKIGKT